MALFKCAECGKKISDKADACPHCGAPNESPPPKKKGSKAFLVIAGLLALGLIIGGTGEKEAYIDGEDGIGAAIFCEFKVKNSLKSPSTAKFPSINTKKTVRHGHNDVYLVRSYVDSQNGFGAIIRTNFACRAKREENGHWSLMELEFK